jgi:hypothetical protein
VEVDIVAILAEHDLLRLCPTLARVFVDAVVYAYRSQKALKAKDQYFDSTASFEESMHGLKEEKPNLAIEIKGRRGEVRTDLGPKSINFKFHCGDVPFLDRARGTGLNLPPTAHILVCDFPEGWYKLTDGTPVKPQQIFLFIPPGDDAAAVFTANQQSKAITFHVRDNGEVEWDREAKVDWVNWAPYIVRTKAELRDRVYETAMAIERAAQPGWTFFSPAAALPPRPSLFEIEMICTSAGIHIENLAMHLHCEKYELNLWGDEARRRDPAALLPEGAHAPCYVPLYDGPVDYHISER